jgi:putative transposase
VELNPVRAGLVGEASEWPWSSAAAHIGGSDRAAILDNSAWGAMWTAALWREALGQGIADAALLERIRQSTRTGRPAAGEEFIGQLEAMAHRLLRPQKHGPGRKPAESSGQMALGGW